MVKSQAEGSSKVEAVAVVLVWGDEAVAIYVQMVAVVSWSPKKKLMSGLGLHIQSVQLLLINTYFT